MIRRRTSSTQLMGRGLENFPQTDVRPRKQTVGFARVLLSLLVLFILYLTPPLVLRNSSWARDAMVFVHHIKTPLFTNISDPASFGLVSTRNFELTHEDGCTLELWQVLPSSYHHTAEFLSDVAFASALSDGSPIVLYLHGNTGTRATPHRVDLYKFLAESLGYHVITFDYRGFGNSECYPSERGMMEDGRLVWDWLKETAPKAKVYIWGHSLGSSAATYLAKELCESADIPPGLILDAPFPYLAAAGENHPFSLPYWPIMPLFSQYVLQTFEDQFESAKRMPHIKSPVLILHGQQDMIIPFKLGRQVFEAALESRERNPYLGRVEFVDCGSSGHKDNWSTKQAKEAVKLFVEA